MTKPSPILRISCCSLVITSSVQIMTQVSFTHIRIHMCLTYLVTLRVTNEPFFDRVNSYSVTGRDNDFRTGLRTRDGGCVVSGVRNKNVEDNNWFSFEGCHIWPLEKVSEWVSQGVYRWITDPE